MNNLSPMCPDKFVTHVPGCTGRIRSGNGDGIPAPGHEKARLVFEAGSSARSAVQLT
jgi:hypothetical protein